MGIGFAGALAVISSALDSDIPLLTAVPAFYVTISFVVCGILAINKSRKMLWAED